MFVCKYCRFRTADFKTSHIICILFVKDNWQSWFKKVKPTHIPRNKIIVYNAAGEVILFWENIDH